MSDDVMIQNDQQESAAETPADYDVSVSIGGVPCTLKFRRFSSYSTHVYRELQIPITGVVQVAEVLPHSELEDVRSMTVLDADGKELFTGYGVESLRREHHWYLQRKRSEELNSEYAAKLQHAHSRTDALLRSGMSFGASDLERSLQKATRMSYWALKHHDSGALPSLFRHIEKELDRLEAASPLEEFIKGMLAGTQYHRDAYENNAIVAQALVWSIRTGGLIDPIDQVELEKFYRGRLASCETVVEFQGCNLRLDSSAYLPGPDFLEEIEQDPDQELAPEQVLLPGNKGEAAYRITYGLTKQGDSDVPTGTIEVPLSVYEKLAPEYGKKSGFPTLPHDIQLNVKVTCDGKLIAEGFDTLELADKIRKVKKARGRRKFAGLEGGTSLITGEALTPGAVIRADGQIRSNRRR